MFVILWEFEVKPGNQVAFENAYGPAGIWVRFFQRDAHFRGTQPLQDSARPLYYFTLDFRVPKLLTELYLDSNQAACEELDRSFANLTRHERHIISSLRILRSLPNAKRTIPPVRQAANQVE
jgi:hypothetical protein